MESQVIEASSQRYLAFKTLSALLSNNKALLKMKREANGTLADDAAKKPRMQTAYQYPDYSGYYNQVYAQAQNALTMYQDHYAMMAMLATTGYQPTTAYANPAIQQQRPGAVPVPQPQIPGQLQMPAQIPGQPQIQPQLQAQQHAAQMAYPTLGPLANYQAHYAAHLAMPHSFASAPLDPANRTIYLGGVPEGITYEELLSNVRGGMIETCRILPDKTCAFISFVDAYGAGLFHYYHNAGGQPLTLREQKITVGWGKMYPLSNTVAGHVSRGATRCVFLGGIDDSYTPQWLIEELGKFGEIDSVKVLYEKKIAFVHFTSITNAVKCVDNLSSSPAWDDKKLSYGKDRCDKPINGQKSDNTIPGQVGPYEGGYDSHANLRQVYLGGIAPDTTASDICNVVRGGILLSVRVVPDKTCAFVTFAGLREAADFLNYCNTTGIYIKSRRVKANWGKPVPLSHALDSAIRKGASRNIFFPTLTEGLTVERLRADFKDFGELEQVHILPEKNSAFVNFNCLADAIKAFEALNANPFYSALGMRYGKDRCANAVRFFQPRAHHPAPAVAAPAAPTAAAPMVAPFHG
ncbi:hypothetical protein L0F63_003256 [Massospora cicadina]|nr:hypothetical protein L0F63_003256 [Massospora cicadina]